MGNPIFVKTRDELEFVIFCIENLALRRGKNASDIYAALNNDSNNMLQKYIVPGYEFLHTQDKEYILDDIEDAIQSQGVIL